MQKNSLYSLTVVNRLKEIEAAASQALQEASRYCNDIGLPLNHHSDIEMVAGLLTGGPVKSCPNLTVGSERMAGLLVGEGELPTIFFEKYDPPVRQRFSICHELGHFFLHPRNDISTYSHCTINNVDQSENYEETQLDQEEEADAFAAAFLLPLASLARDLENFGHSIPFLAERYRVSESTVRRRLKTLKVIQK